MRGVERWITAGSVVAEPPSLCEVPVPALRDPARSLSHVLGVGDGVGLPEHLLLKTVLGLPELAVCITQPLLAHGPQYVEPRGA